MKPSGEQRKTKVILSFFSLIVFGVLLLAAVSGVAIAGPAWQEEWERVLRAAKSEGKLAMIGPLGTDRRDALTEAFQSKYGITVEYHADAGAGILPRLSAERKAGLYLWDVLVSGTSTVLENLIPNKIVDPLEPTLILPEVKESKNWRGGALEFLDPGRQLLVMTLIQRGTLYVNSNLVNPKEFSSYKDLLDPKWKGKIVGDDPRKSGTGQASFLFFYRHPELGADFIRALGRQGLTLLKNYAQEVDMLGQGRFPLGIGLSDSMIEERTKRGVPILIVDPRQIKEERLSARFPAVFPSSTALRIPMPPNFTSTGSCRKKPRRSLPGRQDTSAIGWMCRPITRLPGGFPRRAPSKFTISPPRRCFTS
jgi:ABC-type Fe3+ transport system substrate-binding protein